MKHMELGIKVSLHDNIFGPDYFSTMQAYTCVSVAQPGNIIALHRRYRFGSSKNNDDYSAATFTQEGIKIMTCEDMIMDDTVSRDEMKRFVRLKRSQSFVSKDDLNLAHYDRIPIFCDNPSFDIFLTPNGIIGLTNEFKRPKTDQKGQDTLSSAERLIDGIIQIYLPEPRSSHEQIMLIERMIRMKAFTASLIDRFCPELTGLNQLPLQVR